ncbi:MAG: hypothetical protein EB084_21375, partial [Proteobacteria bacterium]|nr:hypothetical protein [Pseudomonadota bacterium]
DIRTEGVLLYPRWAYFSGPPAGILANIDRSLTNPSLTAAVRAKLEAQKAGVLAEWSAPKNLAEIDVTPRSPFVPVEAVQDWINDLKIDPKGGRRVYPPSLQDAYGPLRLSRENDFLVFERNEAYKKFAEYAKENKIDLAPIYWLLGYCNRASMVDKVSVEDDGGTTPAYKTGKTADGKREHISPKIVLETDEKYVNLFREWLSESKWVDQVESEYNTRFAPRMISKIPTVPLSIAGQSPSVVLHPHQNQIVRRCTMGGKTQPFLWAADVGAGKTFAGSATLLRWRQIGAARRPIAVVPTSVLEKWYADGKRAFPNARIGVIGINPASDTSPRAREALAVIADLNATLARYEGADTPEKYAVLHRSVAKREGWEQHRQDQIQKINTKIDAATLRSLATRLDSPDTRLEKWLRFAAGGYDYLICGMDAFFRDVEPSPEEVGEVLLGLAWARRDSAKEANEIRRQLERIARMKRDLAAYTAATTPELYKSLHSKIADTPEWSDHRAKQIADLTTKIETTQASVSRKIKEMGGLGTQAELVKIQAVIRGLVDSRKYRPNAGSDEDTEQADDAKEVKDNEARQAESGDETPSEEAEDTTEVAEDVQKSDDTFQPLPGLVMWSDLGIDAIVVDEAHRYKNLWFPIQKIEYAGKGQDGIFVGTRRSWDMLIKTRLIHRNANGAGGVLFLTATPMVNSPLELYTLIDMVNPRVWQDTGIHHKEAFIERYWELATKSILRSNGYFDVKLILKGFKNGDEMMGVISTVFQRLSTAELIAQGWIKNLPDTKPYRLDFARDGAQVAVIKTLAAIYAGWIPKKGQDPTKQTAGCGIETQIDLNLWVVNPETGEPEITDVSTAFEDLDENFPNVADIVTDEETEYAAKGVLSLIWQSLATKAAMSPILILDYAERSADRIQDTMYRGGLWNQHDLLIQAWEASGKKGPKPDVPRTPAGKRISRPKRTEYIRDAILTDLLPALGLDEIRAYYQKNPVIPKIAKLAQIVATNVDRALFMVPGFRDESALPQVQAAVADAIRLAGHEYAVFVQMQPAADNTTYTAVVSGPRVQVQAAWGALTARGVAATPVQDQGRCGHVVFCDFKILHPQILKAIVSASRGAIPENRIVFLPADKAKRLLVSQEFNGSATTPPKYDVVIGSSALMSEGVDLQRRSCAVHHLDLPWEPATLHQRNGRAVRQGNTMHLVDVIYYLTEKSYDAVRFDKIANKGAWWESVFSGQRSTSNPAAEKSDELNNIDEIILSMVIEDPEILAICIQALRDAAMKLRISELIKNANREWVAINGLFDRARS